MGGRSPMPKGGARVNSGPPPDPNALRRDRQQDRDGWTTLPAEGRPGRPPAWPLADVSAGEGGEKIARALKAREKVIWSAIWKTPQAVAWERLGWTHDVAVYVRLLVFGEQGSTKALAEARQWSDRLGLNPSAMLRNRWKISTDDVKARRDKRAAATASSSVKDRLKAINGGAR